MRTRITIFWKSSNFRTFLQCTFSDGVCSLFCLIFWFNSLFIIFLPFFSFSLPLSYIPFSIFFYGTIRANRGWDQPGRVVPAMVFSIGICLVLSRAGPERRGAGGGAAGEKKGDAGPLGLGKWEKKARSVSSSPNGRVWMFYMQVVSGVIPMCQRGLKSQFKSRCRSRPRFVCPGPA